MPKTLENVFLNEIGYASLTDKENELLNEKFEFKNIDELAEAFNDTETKEKYNKLFNRISNRAIIF